MRGFDAIEPILMETPLDPGYGYKCLNPQIFGSLPIGDFRIVECGSISERFRYNMMQEVRHQLAEKLFNYLRNRSATVNDILTLPRGEDMSTLLLDARERALVTEEAARKIIRTCAYSALRTNWTSIMVNVFRGAVLYALANDLWQTREEDIIQHYIEHRMMRAHGARIMDVIAKL